MPNQYSKPDTETDNGNDDKAGYRDLTLDEFIKSDLYTNAEWLEDYEGTGIGSVARLEIVNKQRRAAYEAAHGTQPPGGNDQDDKAIKKPTAQPDSFSIQVSKKGIEVYRLGNGLHIKSIFRPFSKLRLKWVKDNYDRLLAIAQPDQDEQLFIVSGLHETKVIGDKYIETVVIPFKEARTGMQHVRYFNAILETKGGRKFVCGYRGEFRPIGSYENHREGSFMHFWVSAFGMTKQIKPSRLWTKTHMLRGVVVSCDQVKPIPKHGISKLTRTRFEGFYFEK